jgi:hypothetical protein
MKLLKILVIALFCMLSGQAMAAPVICSPGYQDSSCVTPLVHAAAAAPTCPTGETQTTAPHWAGSAWVGLACAIPAAPTCPAGETQTAAPTWNGSAWVGLGCQIPVAQPVAAPTVGLYFRVSGAAAPGNLVGSCDSAGDVALGYLANANGTVSYVDESVIYSESGTLMCYLSSGGTYVAGSW